MNYGDRSAGVQMIDGQPDDLLCHDCAVERVKRPSDWVRSIPRASVRDFVRQRLAEQDDHVPQPLIA